MSRRGELLAERCLERIPALLAEAGIRPETCIIHTRIGLEALRAHGVRAEALTVELRALNPAMARRLVHSAAVRWSEAEHEQARQEGAWEVDVGLPKEAGPSRPPPGTTRGWHGHLVVVVERRLMLDLSLAQASRPKKDLELRAMGFRVDNPFLSGQEPLVWQSPEGLTLVYSARPRDRSFLGSPAWSTIRPSDELVHRAIAALG